MNRYVCRGFAAILCGCLAGCEPQAPSSSATAPASPAPAVAESMKAQVGVGAQGRSLDGEQGVGKMIAGPAIALFAAKERIVFEIQVPHALNLFNASEGRMPRSHEEFMTKVIKANNINLPKLPPDKVYRFNTELNELWVDPVAPAPSAAGAASPAPVGP